MHFLQQPFLLDFIHLVEAGCWLWIVTEADRSVTILLLDEH
jgi:hypothetical protein